MKPAQDSATDEKTEYASFSMLNIAPQVPGLNRAQWEHLEESVRSWALQRGVLIVYVGPVIGDKPKHLHDIAVPAAFWKVIVDKKSGEVLAFEMPQKSIAKGDLSPWLTAVTAIEQEAGVKFPGHLVNGNALWPTDIAAWHKAHSAACK
jgi:endonuclease G